jgi:hypothetical protein
VHGPRNIIPSAPGFSLSRVRPRLSRPVFRSVFAFFTFFLSSAPAAASSAPSSALPRPRPARPFGLQCCAPPYPGHALLAQSPLRPHALDTLSPSCPRHTSRPSSLCHRPPACLAPTPASRPPAHPPTLAPMPAGRPPADRSSRFP